MMQKYCFTLIDIGAHGRQTNGGIFKLSAMGAMFYQGKMNLPRERRISLRRPPLPYVLVANEALQLTTFLMRPFPGRNIEQRLSVEQEES